MSYTSYTWIANEDINRADGLATFKVADTEFKLELKNFHQTIIIDCLIKKAYNQGRSDVLCEAAYAISNISEV